MINGSNAFASSAAFRRSVEDRLKAEAKATSRPLENVRREFVFQRLLALVFAADSTEWVLKGGGGLLMRLAGARFSKDLDLTHTSVQSREDAVEALRRAIEPQDGDHLTFTIAGQPKYSAENEVVTVTVRSATGVTEYVKFSIDVSTRLHMLAKPERVTPRQVVDVPGLPGSPEIVVYPISDQIADKVCAMYELHGSTNAPSTRYRDLVDLVLIVRACDLNRGEITMTLQSEAARRSMTLPSRMSLPSPTWVSGYRQIARTSSLPKELHDAAYAVSFVSRFFDPLLGVLGPRAGSMSETVVAPREIPGTREAPFSGRRLTS